MIQLNLTEWDADLDTSLDQEYAALVRAIRWAKGFGLLFVQCAPVEGEQLIERVQADVTEKTVDVLRLESEIDDLYETLAAKPEIDNTNVLFIVGLEKSLTPYIQAGYGSEGDYYAKDKIPKILGRLNLQRERFKERFKLCFVFLAPRYAMKYIVRRAADFFDWRSGVWEFISPQRTLQQETQKVLQAGDFEKYLNWTPQQRRERGLTIEYLIAEGAQSKEEASQLWFEQGNILAVDQDFDSAIASYDNAISLKPDLHQAWFNRGLALSALDQHEAAIASYDNAISLKPNLHKAWNHRGLALDTLGRHEAAIASYDKAIEVKPDYTEAYYNKARCYSLQRTAEKAAKALQQAIELNPECREMSKTDSDFDNIRENAQFQALLAANR